MDRHPYDEYFERRAEPSARAQEARDQWLAANGGEEAVKRRIAGGGGPSSSDLADMAAKWQEQMLTKGIARIRANAAYERHRQLVRVRRKMALAIIICALITGSALGLVVWYSIPGRH